MFPHARKHLCAVTVMIVLALIGRALACGPHFPDSILTSDDAVLAPPLGSFGAELQRATAGLVPVFTARVATNNLMQETVDADLADLRKAVSDRRVIAAYRKMRERLRDYVTKVDEWEDVQSWRGNSGGPQPSRPQLPPLVVPAGLPTEFAGYLAGAWAYHQGRLEEARGAWTTLLRRPVAERRLRSVWAAYMLGRSWVDADPAQAVQWLAATRDLAGKGFADSLGLAAASLGWQGRAELNRHRPAEAIELYLAQYLAGDGTAIVSLRMAASTLVELDRDGRELRKAARQQNLRRVLTAYFVARAGRQPEVVPQEILVRWLQAVGAERVATMQGADRLAWLAYQAGQWDAAKKWLKRAPPQSPIGGWVRAKLLLRDGRVEEAAKALGVLVRSFPADNDWQDAYTRFDPESSDGRPTHAAPVQVRGELGVLQLARGQYVDALASLMVAGYWLDAAYIAERVLTIEELRAYVDRQPPLPTTEVSPDGSPGGPASLRLLLARRLARSGRLDAARPYFEAPLRPKLDAYAGALRRGRDSARPARERAAALWEAAKIARWAGLDLLSTEVEPDWHYAEAQFELESFSKERAPSERRRVVGGGADEQRRAAASAAAPHQRFHYRYRATGLAWEASQLMPDQNDETARVLCEAGTWLKLRDPRAADRFYKALVKRCGTTALGREAARRRWFPDLAEE